MSGDDVYFYEPGLGHGLDHDPFKAIIAPRVIGWISTRDKNGVNNIAPHSYFSALSTNPPILGFSSEGYKDTIRNIEDTGEFVWNMTTQALAESMNITSARVAPEVDEFELARLEGSAGRLVAPLRVTASPVALECKVLEVKQLVSLGGEAVETWFAIGQVVGVSIKKSFLTDGKFDLVKAQPVLRAGYRGDYFGLGPHFEMLRPE